MVERKKGKNSAHFSRIINGYIAHNAALLIINEFAVRFSHVFDRAIQTVDTFFSCNFSRWCYSLTHAHFEWRFSSPEREREKKHHHKWKTVCENQGERKAHIFNLRTWERKMSDKESTNTEEKWYFERKTRHFERERARVSSVCSIFCLNRTNKNIALFIISWLWFCWYIKLISN